tara:strand:- start:2802 stop:3044 length:243 start_codon:yes stop_codon:yes gene_type:complete
MSTPAKTINRKKSTKRFDFHVNRNPRSHQAAANTVTIRSKDYDTSGRGYSFQANEVPGTVTMTVKEAKALYAFLGKTLNS